MQKSTYVFIGTIILVIFNIVFVLACESQDLKCVIGCIGIGFILIIGKPNKDD
jgi:hypothetical protein